MRVRASCAQDLTRFLRLFPYSITPRRVSISRRVCGPSRFSRSDRFHRVRHAHGSGRSRNFRVARSAVVRATPGMATENVFLRFTRTSRKRTHVCVCVFVVVHSVPLAVGIFEKLDVTHARIYGVGNKKGTGTVRRTKTPDRSELGFGRFRADTSPCIYIRIHVCARYSHDVSTIGSF